MANFCILTVLLVPSSHPAPFIPSPAFCSVENRLWLLLLLLKAEMDLLLLWVRSECDTFHFNFFPSGYAESSFFAWVTKQVLEEWESCCYVTFCCLICLLLVVTTAVKGLSIVEPYCTLHGGSSLTPDSSSTFIFLFLFLRRSVKAKELEAIRIEDGKCSQPEFQL